MAVIAGPAQYRATGGEWSAALINEPVANGTGLRTAADSETELRGPGVRVALGPSSELQVLRYDASALQIALTNGRIGIHLGPADAAKTVEIDLPKTVEIDLPQGGVWLSAPGDYDISAGGALAQAAVQVFAGDAKFGGGLDATHIAAPGRDGFSDWWRSQDDNADLSAPVKPVLAGAAALAADGRWEVDPKLGNIWFPSDVAADWTPYRDGLWRYLPPWGWTWIDNAAWGFAPSHYGRWVQIDGKWAWVPGDRVAAADYSPAVVAFLGTAGYGLSRPGDIGTTPAVAWFPLGPGETVGDADGAYQNRRFATAVPRTSFAAGLPVATALVGDVPERRFIDAPVILSGLGIAPAGAPAAVAGAKPVETPVAAVAAGRATMQADTAPEAATVRQPFVVALRDAPARVVRAVHEVRSKLRLATAALRAHVSAIPDHARRLASVYHSPHNRRHLAAARGGA
ncbi:MAG TPA: DUF6600 domain-containing protein [Stellaceae bacterium]|nr:DUF6600 domain-containing protein [Stellaceae bacterium]